MTVQNLTETICMNCESNKLVLDENLGEIVCSQCGNVVSQQIEDNSLAWKSNDSYWGDLQNGPNISVRIHDMGLSTQIGTKNRDSGANH